MIKKLLFAACIALSTGSYSATVYDTLYLNRDTVEMGSMLVNRCVFNDDMTFDKQNANIQLDVGDVLELTIYNIDTVSHDVAVANGNALGTIAAGANSSYSIPFNDFGTFGVKATDTRGDLLGAFAVIRVGLIGEISFVWNLWDINDTLSLDIGTGVQSSIPIDYRPNVYTINSEVYPQTSTEPLGAVSANVGDTIYVSIVNSGNMVHTLHYHGFHFEFLQVAQRTHVTNWIKDSAPMFIDETTTIRFVPDKPGMYPVHDHNLISVLTENTYPGGMITTLNIQP